MFSNKDAAPATRPSVLKGQDLSNEDYDPYLYREVNKPTTSLDTFIHCIKGSVGSGILAMPHGLLFSGTIAGVIFTVGLSTLLVYAILLLVRIQYQLCKIKKVPFIAYPSALKQAWKLGPKGFRFFAPAAPIIVDFFLVSYQLGICCSYIAFISNSLEQIMNTRVFKYEMSNHWYLLMILVPVLAINCIRNLKNLTPISLLADILTIVGLCIIFYYIFGTGAFNYQTTTYFGHVLKYPVFLGIVMFALEAVGVVLALEKNMTKPQEFPKVFCSAMILVVCLYTLVGLSGYMKYGDKVQVSITDSMPSDTTLSLVLKIIFAICLYCSHPLQCYVSLEIIWHNYLIRHIKGSKRELLAEYGMRALVIFITFIIVFCVNDFDLIISFVGAFCLSTLGLVFPFSMELCLLWPDRDHKWWKYKILKDILGIIAGVIILISGTYMTIFSILEKRNQ